MKLILLSALLVSCTHYSKPIIHSVNYQVGVKCPDNYYYRLNDNMCYPITVNKPITAIERPINTVVRVKARKPLKKAKIDCKQVFKDINQCSQ